MTFKMGVKTMKTVPVITYGRMSTKQQTESLAQQKDCFDLHLREEWLSNLIGGTPIVAEEYKDDGKSASKKKSKRHDFHRLLRDVQTKHRGKYLLVVNQSRLSRGTHWQVDQLVHTLRDCNVQVVDLEERKIIRNEEFEDWLLTGIKAKCKREESEQTGRNALRGRYHRVKDGRCVNSIAPYGMCKLVIDETGAERIIPRTQPFSKPKDWKCYLVPGDTLEQETDRWMFQKFATEDVSACQLATMLNQHENPLVRSGPTGQGWNDRTVKNILANWHLAGYEFMGMHATGEHYRLGSNGEPCKAKEGIPLLPSEADRP